jgi:hypothetical protein
MPRFRLRLAMQDNEPAKWSPFARRPANAEKGTARALPIPDASAELQVLCKIGKDLLVVRRLKASILAT